ncbi:MAG TPA: primase-helicase zinc-binding domain-containing protein, partial [bacterium]|nr:primase-helicase zinc-binding domain-containing protein [bacterium]
MNLVDEVRRDGIQLKKVSGTSGGEWHGPCPFCGGKDRFRVQPDHNGKGRWACRQCDKSGDIYSYLQERRGMSFPEAKQYLGETQPPRTTPILSQEQEQQKRLAWAKLADKLVRECEARLWTDKGKQALEYLRGRLLRNDTIKTMRLGYNELNGRLFGTTGSKVAAGITIPWLVDGEVVCVNVRRLKPQGKEKRYKAVGGSSKDLYFLPVDDKTLCVVEGELDAGLVLQELGLSVAAVGSNTAISNELKALVQKFECVVLIPDGDEAGSNMVEKWQSQFDNIQVFRLPSHDVTDFVKSGANLDAWWREQEDAIGKV